MLYNDIKQKQNPEHRQITKLHIKPYSKTIKSKASNVSMEIGNVIDDTIHPVIMSGSITEQNISKLKHYEKVFFCLDLLLLNAFSTFINSSNELYSSVHYVVLDNIPNLQHPEPHISSLVQFSPCITFHVPGSELIKHEIDSLVMVNSSFQFHLGVEWKQLLLFLALRSLN